MSDEAIEALAAAIVDATFLSKPLFFLLVAAISLVAAAAGAFGGAYFRKRGEQRAITADFDDFKAQQADLAAMLQQVKSKIDAEFSERQTVRQLLREKFEAAFAASNELMVWINGVFTEAINARDFDLHCAARAELSMYQKIYFPDVANSYLTLNGAVLDLQQVAIDTLGEVRKARRENRAPTWTTSATEFYGPKHMKLITALSEFQDAMITTYGGRVGLADH